MRGERKSPGGQGQGGKNDNPRDNPSPLSLVSKASSVKHGWPCGCTVAMAEDFLEIIADQALDDSSGGSDELLSAAADHLLWKLVHPPELAQYYRFQVARDWATRGNGDG